MSFGFVDRDGRPVVKCARAAQHHDDRNGKAICGYDHALRSQQDCIWKEGLRLSRGIELQDLPLGFFGYRRLFSSTDDSGDDSAYLPNGYTVQINTFKDSTAGGNVEMFVDIESRPPRYVYFSVTGAAVVAGGCVPAKGVGIGFYSPEAYRAQHESD
ncbi:hypothetical protein [Paraburkholderia acidipaludis]|uniref:hypothetical protein n=1 Tax=Paraburkholderia acidipaludis TaxID=660537 RepID=UPI001FDF36CD|nr:hypothetical protein [Paraburkholderia acidipaludis]